MGREVRRVPENWEHPKNSMGHLVPLMEGPFLERLKEWEEGKAQWNNGLREDYANGGYKPRESDELGMSFEEWSGKKPQSEDYMPEWSEEKKTHIMMYEDCTEGTPISPAFKIPEELARWLVDNGASAFGTQTASYESWLNVCKGAFAPSAVIINGEFKNGVDGINE